MVRIKERYLLVKIIYPDGETPAQEEHASVQDVVLYNQPTTDALTPQTLLKGIRTSVRTLFGDYGSGVLDRSLQVKYLSTATSTFIIRSSRSHFRLAWAALTFMDCLPVKNGAPCVFRVVHVSGTIRKVEEEAIRRARLLILQAKNGKAAAPSGDALKSLFASDALDDGESSEDDGIAQGASEDEDAMLVNVDG